MTAALTPVLALAFLRELSADIRAAIVLDAVGEVLAADAAPGAPARDVVADAAAPARDAVADHAALAAAARDILAEAPLVRAMTPHGGAFGARDDRHGIVVATGPLALPRLVIHDLQSVLAALGGAPSHAAVSEASPAAAQAVLDALR